VAGTEGRAGWRGLGPEKFEELIEVLEKFELEKLGFEKFEKIGI